MTMFERIREAAFLRLSKVLNKDDEEYIEEAISADLDPYLTGVVRDLNEQHSAARVVPLRRAS